MNEKTKETTMENRNLEHRTLPTEQAEMRVEPTEGGQKLTGYAAVFERRSVEIPDLGGGFVEEIAPGAFRSVMDDPDRDVRALFNHDVNRVLGRESAGSLSLAVDQRGLRYEVELPDTTTGREVAQLVERGDVDGSSFTFKIAEGGESVSREGDDVVRRVEDIEFVRDVGPGVFAAYPDSTASLSSRTLEQARELMEADAETDEVEDGEEVESRTEEETPESDAPEDTTDPEPDTNAVTEAEVELTKARGRKLKLRERRLGMP